MKKTATAATAIAVAVAATTALPAHAEPAITQLSTALGSSGSSKPNYDNLDSVEGSPDKRLFEGSYTGSAPISLTIAFVATAVAIQAIVDFVPPVREAVDKYAEQFNLQHVPGSSEGNRIFPAEQIKAQVNQAIQDFQAQL